MCRIKFNEKTKSLELENNEIPIIQTGIEKIIDIKKGIVLTLWNDIQKN